MTEPQVRGLTGRLLIEGDIYCATGLHIGGGKDNMAIGVVDSMVIRDPLTRRPIIPGSSIKGKMRTLLAKTQFNPEAANFDFSKLDIKHDAKELKRLFGSINPIILSRLQFCDAPMNAETVTRLDNIETDLYLSEVKYENTINRISSVANPRQIERVPAGSGFSFKLIYLIEDGVSAEELQQDFMLIKEGLVLLQQDYLGGHGSRGSGRIVFRNLTNSVFTYADKSPPSPIDALQSDVQNLLDEVRSMSFFDALLPSLAGASA